MANGLVIQIEYCTPWNYLPRAVWMAEELLLEHGQRVATLALVPSAGGRFEVTVNGELVFSKAELGRFPELKELKEKVAGKA